MLYCLIVLFMEFCLDAFIMNKKVLLYSSMYSILSSQVCVCASVCVSVRACACVCVFVVVVTAACVCPLFLPLFTVPPPSRKKH